MLPREHNFTLQPLKKLTESSEVPSEKNVVLFNSEYYRNQDLTPEEIRQEAKNFLQSSVLEASNLPLAADLAIADAVLTIAAEDQVEMPSSLEETEIIKKAFSTDDEVVEMRRGLSLLALTHYTLQHTMDTWSAKTIQGLRYKDLAPTLKPLLNLMLIDDDKMVLDELGINEIDIKGLKSIVQGVGILLSGRLAEQEMPEILQLGINAFLENSELFILDPASTYSGIFQELLALVYDSERGKNLYQISLHQDIEGLVEAPSRLSEQTWKELSQNELEEQINLTLARFIKKTFTTTPLTVEALTVVISLLPPSSNLVTLLMAQKHQLLATNRGGTADSMKGIPDIVFYYAFEKFLKSSHIHPQVKSIYLHTQ